MKKILLFGNFYEGNCAFELFNYLDKSNLKAVKFKRNIYFNNKTFLNKVLVHFFSLPLSALLNINLLIKFWLVKPDIFIAIKGLNIHPFILKLLQKKSITFNWNLDDFFNLKNSNKTLIKCLPVFDCIISPKKELFNNYISFGAKKLIFIENYFLPKYHFPEIIKQKFLISFIGSWSNKRDDYLDYLSNYYEINVFGNSWIKKNKSPNIKKFNEVKPGNYREIVSQSHINLNFFTDENSDTSNLRLFEIPACRGLLLSEFSERATKIFKPNQSVIYFSDKIELLKKVKLILELNKKETDIIKLNAYKNVKSHSFKNRCDEIVNSIIKL